MSIVTTPPEDPAPRTLRDLAEEVAVEAAALARLRWSEGVEVAATKSSASDPVTEADREVEAFLRDRLAEARPGDGFLGEEGGAAEAPAGGVTWVVDPIDGTVNFLYGLPGVSVSVAASVDDVVVAGAVVSVPHGTRWTAALGDGATRDGAPLRVREVAPMGQRLVLTGFNYDAGVRALQGQAVARLLPQVRDIRRHGSAAMELCRVAEGSADAYVEEGLNLWDHAAGALVATEAGAVVEHLPGVGGRPCTVAAPAAAYDDLVALIRECGFLSVG